MGSPRSRRFPGSGFVAILLFVGPAAHQVPGSPASDPELLSGSDQHLVAVVETPESTSGRLYRFQRVDGKWESVGAGIPMVVGRRGVGPKKEGDGHSPRGVFPLGFAFGYRERAPVSTAMTYRHLPPEAVCVDDSGSGRYNRIVFEPGPDRDWESAEAMRRDLAHGDDLYALGVTVEYNPDAVPEAGSCIFLHIWRSPESPTAGCTAMAEPDLRTVLGWLQPRHDPILVQGSRAYLEELHAEGLLPYEVPGA
ncbi:MAG: L,D-transpeptidase family protein [Gemmatimonadota bacterium]